MLKSLSLCAATWAAVGFAQLAVAHTALCGLLLLTVMPLDREILTSQELPNVERTDIPA